MYVFRKGQNKNASEGGAKRERERENPKQALSLSVRS